jgi:uncharacterized protein (TIGR00369 family)
VRKEVIVTEHSWYNDESPFLSYLGTELLEWSDGHVRIGLQLRPHHLNRSGVVHGGVLAALMDHGGSFSGLYCTVSGNRRYSMTLSLTSNYLGQDRSGYLTVIGERTGGGKSIYFARTEVLSQAGVRLASSASVHRYRKGSEPIEGVPVERAAGVT